MTTVPSPDGMRFAPSMPVTAFRTYHILSPISTHFRDGTCAEADCPSYLHGWRTTIDETTDLGQEQAYYIRHGSKRKYVENRIPGLTVFTFEAGQTCFQGGHKVRVERPEIYVARGGDWRGNPTGEIFRHTSAESWTDDFATHQDKLATQVERG